MTNISEIVRAIKSVLPKKRPLELHEPYYNIDSATALLHRSLLIGPNINYYVDEFEKAIAIRTGAKHVISVSSGTAALHLALMAAGVKSGDEVLVPSSTFVATANAVVHAGAVPHFFDSEDVWFLNSYLSNNKQITALVPVHLFGIKSNLVHSGFGTTIIEDAAQALGTKGCGTVGEAGILSFNNNKIITTGGGGAVLTNDDDLAQKVRELATTCRVKHPWLVEHHTVGWNYRMSELAAAFGLSQLEIFEEILERKAALKLRYCMALSGIEGCKVLGNTDSNNWLTVILVENGRDELLAELHKEGIKARASFTPLHLLSMYKNNPRSSQEMPLSLRLFNQAICLPSSPNLV